MTVDLNSQPVIGGKIRTSHSPSVDEETYRWPDGHVERVKFSETTTTIEYKGVECTIFTRGSLEHEQFLDSLEEFEELREQAKKKAEDDADAALSARLKAVDDEQGSAIDDTKVAASNARDDDGEMTCEFDPPHYDCKDAAGNFLCADELGLPRHFNSPRALDSHKRAAKHKAAEEAAGLKVEV